ncbi:hypothetical protein FRB98_008410 [Tulasnella sp. 332]|nr:hypothetical protein FRB98_008410 [Tulasnella sp. 332]
MRLVALTALVLLSLLQLSAMAMPVLTTLGSPMTNNPKERRVKLEAIAKQSRSLRHRRGLASKLKPHSPLSNHVPESGLTNNGERFRRGLPPAPPPKFVIRKFGKSSKRVPPTKRLDARGPVPSG